MDEKVTMPELYDAYVECRTKKRGTIPCADFELNEADNLYQLWEDLNTGTYEINESDAFCVTRPKDGRIYTGNRTVGHLYDLIRLQADTANKTDTVERFMLRYNSLAGFLVHTHSYNIRCRAWFLVDEETKTYLEQPPWSFKKIRVLPQYTKQYQTIQLCTKSKCLKRTG